MVFIYVKINKGYTLIVYYSLVGISETPQLEFIFYITPHDIKNAENINCQGLIVIYFTNLNRIFKEDA